jgi:hypothetical protein
MSANDVTYYVEQYSTILQALLQQMDARFRPYVMTGNHVGDGAAVVDQYGSIEAQQPVGRNQALVGQDVTADRRWVYPNEREVTRWVNKYDKLRMLIDPTSEFMRGVAAGMARAEDDIIINAFFGTAQTGNAGGTATTFPSAQQVSVDTGGTGSGLNVDKLLRGKRILAANQVDPSEEIYCAVSAVQTEDLLKQAQVVSSDFNTVKPLADGKVVRFLGINFFPSERLLLNASSQRRVPLWVKSGMHMGVWGDTMSDITQRKDLSGFPWQIHSNFTKGATRVEEGRVVELICAE